MQQQQQQQRSTRLTFIPLERVWSQPEAFDTSHHPSPLTDEGFAAALARTSLSVWAHVLGCAVAPLLLAAADARVLLAAGRSGVLTGRVPEMHREELGAVAQAWQATGLLSSPPYFARLERCSLKDGALGAGPFCSAQDLVAGLVTSWRAQAQLARAVPPGSTLEVFLMPWQADMDPRHEFRVFVHEGRVTAASQYLASSHAGWDDGAPETTAHLHGLAAAAQQLCDHLRQRAPRLPGSFTLDVLYRRGGRMRLVEVNSFGASMAAGSALFHWLHDHDRLHGRFLPEVEVRVTQRGYTPGIPP